MYRLLLEGKVVKSWAELITPLLNDPPALLTTPMKGMPSKKVTMLLLAFKSSSSASSNDSSSSSSLKRKSSGNASSVQQQLGAVVNLKSLMQRLNTNPKFIHEAIGLWIKNTSQKEKVIEKACSEVIKSV
jgi:hypothetical protein